MTTQVKASHILVKTLQEAQTIKASLNSGIPFAQIAANVSQCPSKQNGGDLGYFTRGQMVKPFEDAAFALNVNEISNPVQTQFGFHIIKRTA